jgi:hypothetical protein
MFKLLVTAIFALFTIILAGQPSIAASSHPTICPYVYLPVCGTIGATQQTFGNSCLAHAGGATIVVPGACPAPIKFCPTIYLPVCAIKYGIRRTYSNSCEATRAGATVIAKGQCVPLTLKPLH